MNETKRRIIGAVAGVVVGLGFALLCPDIGLDEAGVRCLGILLGAIVWWVSGVLPDYATALVMVALFAIAAGVGVDVSLSAFASGTWWLLVGAFALGAGMQRSGLLRRMALAIIRRFPRSFSAQSAGLMAASMILGPLIPSLSAKVSILEPIALNIGDSMGYERGGKQMQGLFMSVLSGVRTIGPAAVTASIDGYALLAVLPAATQERFDLFSWFIAALPWLAVTTALTFACIQLMYRPRGREAEAIEAAAADALSTGPGPMGRDEKLMLAIVLAAILMWITEPLHHIVAHVVALIAFACMIACGILDTESVRTKLNWTSLVFIGIMISMASVFAETGIQDWIVDVAQPVFAGMVGNPYLFIVGIGLMTIALRFLIVSEIAYINVMMAFLVPLALSAGVEPWVVGFAIYATVNPWFAPYQNPIYLAAYYSVDGKMTSHAAAARFCGVYLACCLVALAASVPYWQWMGLL